MRRLLTTGIKAILAVAALTTAAHWTMRLQRDPTPQIASVPALPADPVTTGSISPRQTEAVQAETFARSEGADLDQSHLAKLFSDAAAPKPMKAVARR